LFPEVSNADAAAGTATIAVVVIDVLKVAVADIVDALLGPLGFTFFVGTSIILVPPESCLFSYIGSSYFTCTVELPYTVLLPTRKLGFPVLCLRNPLGFDHDLAKSQAAKVTSQNPDQPATRTVSCW